MATRGTFDHGRARTTSWQRLGGRALKLPKGTLLGQRAGSKETLQQLLRITASPDFAGYLRMTAKPAGGQRAEGVMVFRNGSCVLGYLSAPDQIFGQVVLDSFLSYATTQDARLRLYRFDAAESARVDEYTGKHPTASVDLGAVLTSSSGGISPSLDQMLTDLDRVSALTKDLEGALETARVEQTELAADAARLEGARKVIGALVAEEGQQAAQVAEARGTAQERLRQQSTPATDPAMAAEVASLRTKLAALERTETDLRARERKLQDLERIFKRVLTSTEERLKAKEEEIVARERVLKEELESHQRRISELEARASALKAQEQKEGDSASAKAVKRLESERHQLTSTIATLEAEVRSLRAALEVGPPTPAAGRTALIDETLTEDFKALLTALDQLMAHLPQEVVDRFAAGPSFDIYERVMVAFELAKAGTSADSDEEE